MGFIHRRPRATGDAKATESLLLLFLTLILMSIGLLYLPRPSKSIHFDSYLIAQVPKSACDHANCFNPVKRVSWIESHGRDMNGPYVTAWADRMPFDPGPGTVRVALTVEYEYPVTEDTSFSMSLDLPPGARMVRCVSTLTEDSTAGCGQRPTPPGNAPVSRAQFVIGASGTLKHATTAAVLADIQGARGLAFDDSAGEMVVRHPIVIPAPPSFSIPLPGPPAAPDPTPSAAGHGCPPSSSPPSGCAPAPGTQSDPVSLPGGPAAPANGPITVVQASPPEKPIDVYTAVVADGIGTMRWTEMPSAGMAAGPRAVTPNSAGKAADNATWKYSMERDGMNVPPPDIRGVSDAAIAADTKNTFYAGLAFGTGGAAFTIAIQLFYGWLLQRKPRQTVGGTARASGAGRSAQRRRPLTAPPA